MTQGGQRATKRKTSHKQEEPGAGHAQPPLPRSVSTVFVFDLTCSGFLPWGDQLGAVRLLSATKRVCAEAAKTAEARRPTARARGAAQDGAGWGAARGDAGESGGRCWWREGRGSAAARGRGVCLGGRVSVKGGVGGAEGGDLARPRRADAAPRGVPWSHARALWAPRAVAPRPRAGSADSASSPSTRGRQRRRGDDSKRDSEARPRGARQTRASTPCRCSCATSRPRCSRSPCSCRSSACSERARSRPWRGAARSLATLRPRCAERRG